MHMYIWHTGIVPYSQYLTIIYYIDLDNFISGSNGASITGSAETDVKMLSLLKHKVVCDINAH